MLEAEAEAEAAALARGEQPFLVSTTASNEGFLRGAPLVTADGELVGITSLALADPLADLDAQAGESASTRVYAVAATRAARAVEAMVGRLALGEKVSGARVVLFNDPINKREKVQAVLAACGLSEQAANLAMYAAHRTGRGVIGYFDEEEEALTLVRAIAKFGKELELPSALTIQCEECTFYKGSTDNADEPATV